MAEPATKADIDNIVTLLQQHFESSDRQFEAVGKQFEAIGKQFEAISNRLDRITDTLAGVQNQMAAMTRWADRFDRDHTAIIQTQSAQQRAIDELAARITRLEAQKAS